VIGDIARIKRPIIIEIAETLRPAYTLIRQQGNTKPNTIIKLDLEQYRPGRHGFGVSAPAGNRLDFQACCLGNSDIKSAYYRTGLQDFTKLACADQGRVKQEIHHGHLQKLAVLRALITRWRSLRV
jgi:hypothetical protein